MKKKGLIRLLGLASCVSLLAGCGTKVDPELVVKGIPDTFHLGDEINLDSFVSVKGSDKSFDVYLYKASREIATLKDHKIKIKGEGEIKFKVSFGDDSETIKVYSIAEMRERLVKMFGTYTDEYCIQGSTGDFYIHNSEYAERVFSRRSSQSYLRYGYLAPDFSDAMYQYQLDQDVISVEPKISSKDSFSTYSYFNVDLMQAERSIVGEQNLEVYSLTDKQIKSFAQNCLVSTYNAFPVSIPVDDSGAYSNDSSTYAEVNSTITNVLFTLDEQDDSVVPVVVVYAKYQTKTFVADILYFTNSENEQLDDPSIRSIISSKNIPMDASIKNYFSTIIESRLPAEETFVAEFKYGWFNGSGERIDEPSDLEGTVFEGVPVGETTRVFKKDAIVNIENGEITTGLVQHTEDEIKTVYHVKSGSAGHTKVEEPEFEDVYDDKYISLAYLVSDESFADDMAYISKTKDSGTPDDTSDDVFVVGTNLKRSYNFMDGICTCEDNLTSLCSLLYKYLSQGRDFYSYFARTFSLDFNLAGEINCSFSLQWDNGIFYKVSFKLYSDGSGTYDSLVSDLVSELFA